MYALFGLVAIALAPSSDPRQIDPAANRPEIVAPGGSPTKTKPPKTRPPKVTPKPVPKVEPKKAEPKKPEPEPKKPEPEKPEKPEPEPKKPEPEPKKPEPEPELDPKIEPQPEADPKKIEPEPKKPEPTAKPQPKPKADVTADAPLERCFPERGRCWRLNVAGIAMASVGVAALGTGIGFMQAPQFPVPDEPIYNRSLRPPGVVMVALGATTVVTGVLMVVAGHASHGKTPGKKRQTARVRIIPGGLRW